MMATPKRKSTIVVMKKRNKMHISSTNRHLYKTYPQFVESRYFSFVEGLVKVLPTQWRLFRYHPEEPPEYLFISAPAEGYTSRELHMKIDELCEKYKEDGYDVLNYKPLVSSEEIRLKYNYPEYSPTNTTPPVLFKNIKKIRHLRSIVSKNLIIKRANQKCMKEAITPFEERETTVNWHSVA